MKTYVRRRVIFGGCSLLAVIVLLCMAMSLKELPSSPAPTQPGWPEFFRLVLTTFIGAGLAFLSNSLYQNQKETRDNKIAGNLALVTLRDQINDFWVLRKGFGETKDQVLAQSPNAPKWLQGKPIHFYFSDRFKFDFASISFLLGQERASVFALLKLAEQRYYDIEKLVGTYSDAVEAMQGKLAEHGLRDGRAFVMEEAAAAVGPDLVGKITTLFDALEHRFRNDLVDYEKAFTGLRAAMLDEFGAKGVIGIILPSQN